MNDKEKLDKMKAEQKPDILYILGKPKLTMDDFPKITDMKEELKTDDSEDD